jgi:hypothetical protein
MTSTRKNKTSQEVNLPIYVIACKVFQHLLEQHLPADLAKQVIFMDYGLHQYPKKLRSALQEQIDTLPEAGLVVLGYGLCGKGLDGIKSDQHTLLVPRTDDCIAILLGSYQVYRQEFDSEPGTYYLTKGWLEAGSNPLQEYRDYLEKYGQEQADMVMDIQYQNYQRLMFVAHNQEDLDHYRPQALEVARFCERWGMRYEELQGSDDYIRRLVAVTAALNRVDGDFVLVPPGKELKLSQFLR